MNTSNRAPRGAVVHAKRKVVARCHVAAGLALATVLIATGVTCLAYDAPASPPAPPPGSQCSDFGCEK